MDKKPDRNREVRRALREASLRNFKRIPASFDTNGALGCAESHIRALEKASNLGGPAMICEDDIMFSTPDLLDRFLREFLADPFLDVLLIASKKAVPASVDPELANHVRRADKCVLCS